ncbi:hypothetical protein, partial [uncultured Prevotella sp.]|uniref:hypothetical protein n=1 Tax=uncultured Prevotella sp. TaxID=159272 RepID=UPI0025998E6E
RLPQPLETQNKSIILLFLAFLGVIFSSKTTLRVMVVLRTVSCKQTIPSPTGEDRWGLMSAIFSYSIIMIYDLMYKPPLVLPRRGDAGYYFVKKCSCTTAF